MWSFGHLPLVQRIMNTVEKTSTGVTPAELILSHSIRLSSHIMTPVHSSISSSDISLSDRLDEWISRHHTLPILIQEHQLQTILSTLKYCILHPWVVVASYFLNLKDRIKLRPKHDYKYTVHCTYYTYFTCFPDSQFPMFDCVQIKLSVCALKMIKYSTK